MATLPPLSMSQTKDDLLKHLNMGPETYTLMAKETDVVYKWLTSDKYHLKENCKRKPPYDWSDIQEKSKDEAMALIAQSGNNQTKYYWDLAAPTPDCPNWIARWFLYHKFRYRDGRNRNPAKSLGSSKHHHSHAHGHDHESNSKHRHTHHSVAGEEHEEYYDQQEDYYGEESMTPAPASHGYYGGGTTAVSNGYTYPIAQSYPSYNQKQENEEEGTVYYDPVRDAAR